MKKEYNEPQLDIQRVNLDEVILESFTPDNWLSEDTGDDFSNL